MTTITADMLAAMRDAAEHEPDADSAVRAILALVPGVTIADTEEQTMSKMTITQEQYDAAVAAYMSAPMGKGMGVFVAALGIIIAPAEPPEAMVKLAREIAREAVDGGDLYVRVALAALQHAVDVVKGAHAVAEYGDWRVSRSAILNALGAIGAP